jgi:hypothetical protein
MYAQELSLIQGRFRMNASREWRIAEVSYRAFSGIMPSDDWIDQAVDPQECAREDTHLENQPALHVWRFNHEEKVIPGLARTILPQRQMFSPMRGSE